MPSLRCTLSAYGYIGTDCLSASRDNRCLGQVCYAAAETCLRVESMPVPIHEDPAMGIDRDVMAMTSIPRGIDDRRLKDDREATQSLLEAMLVPSSDGAQ